MSSATTPRSTTGDRFLIAVEPFDSDLEGYQQWLSDVPQSRKTNAKREEEREQHRPWSEGVGLGCVHR